MSVETLPQIQNHHAENTAFNLEYKRPVNENSLRDDIVSYLGEYRFKVPTYEYELFYSQGEDGVFALRDRYDGDSMTNKAERAITRKEDSWKQSRRERAELSGLQTLDSQLEQANDGDLVIWASPPGLKEEYYGDYGFIYVGTIMKMGNFEKRLSMTAFRIEDDPSIEKFNFYLTLMSGLQTNFKLDTDFLSNPIVIKSPLIGAKKSLFDVFNFEANSNIQQKFLETIETLSPFINDLIRLTHEGATIDERKQALNVLENLTAGMYKSINNDFSGIKSVIQTLDTSAAKIRFGHKPEIVAGSCGASGSSNNILSNNIFNSIGDINSIFKTEDDDMFECPKCHQLSKPPVGDSCPKCRYTRQQAMKDGQLVC